METRKKEILDKLSACVVDMDEIAAADLAKESLSAGIDPYETIEKGLAAGMKLVSQKYETDEYFVPQLLLCSDAMYAGLKVLRPALKKDLSRNIGRIVIGVVEGDTHDIGKSLVKMMLEAENFEVLDLGRNIPIQNFISEAESFGAQVIAMSTLMTTTMEGMAELVQRLHKLGLREKYKVIVGGGPVTGAFRDKIGADGYAPNANKAVGLVQSLVKR